MNRFTLSLLLLSALAVRMPAQSITWISACSDQTFCIDPGGCTQGTVMMTEQAVTGCFFGSDVDYSYKIDLNNNGGIEVTSANDTCMGVFPKGTHRIYWRASDNCGNVANCNYLFTVKDCTPPNLLCINGLTQNIDPLTCTTSFTPDQFVLTYSDNCTPNNQLQFGIREAGTGTGFPNQDTVTFNQCDIGLNFVEIWIKDGNGLMNICQNYVLVQLNGTDCECNPDGELGMSGCARSAGNKKLTEYTVRGKVESLSGVQPPVTKNISKISTDSCYSFMATQLPFGGQYRATLRAERFGDPKAGVSTFDLVLMSKHILGVDPFTNIYQWLGSDVNKSNSVTTFDIVETRKLLLGIYDSFPANTSWRFIRPVPNPADFGLLSTVKDTYQILLASLNDDIAYQNLNFVGIKIGDANLSASFVGDDVEDRSALTLDVPDRWLAAGETAVVPVRWDSEAELSGWQLALRSDPRLLTIEGVDNLPDDNFYLSPDGSLRAVWFDASEHAISKRDVVFELKVKALQPTLLSEALQLDAQQLAPEAYTPAGARHSLALRFSPAGTNAATAIQVFAPFPNPCDQVAQIGLRTEEAAEAILALFDANGKKVWQEKRSLTAGYQLIDLPVQSMPAGILAWRIEVDGQVFSGRLSKQ